jgi:hypothetical protein
MSALSVGRTGGECRPRPGDRPGTSARYSRYVAVLPAGHTQNRYYGASWRVLWCAADHFWPDNTASVPRPVRGNGYSRPAGLRPKGGE